MKTKVDLLIFMPVVNSFIALGGSADKSGTIDIKNLKRLLNEELGLTIDLDVREIKEITKPIEID